MMSSEDDTDCCYGLQYGDDTTTTGATNVLQLKNKSTTTTITTTISSSSSSSNNCTATTPPTNTNSNHNSPPSATTTVPVNNCGSGGGSSVAGTTAGNCSGTTNTCGITGGGSASQHQLNHRRTRQRVDAGEPRNSYSSIPNFTSRPTFMSGGLYGAIFSQTAQQHFSLFSGTGISGHPAPPTAQNNCLANNNNSNLGGVQQPHHHSAGSALNNNISGNNSNLSAGNNNNTANSSGSNNCNGLANGNHGNSSISNGFGGPAKMLNELLGRQVKQAQDATGPDGNANLIQSSSSTTGATNSSSNTNLDNYLTETGQQQQQQQNNNQQQFSDSGDLQCKNTQSAINNCASAVNGDLSHIAQQRQRNSTGNTNNNCGSVDLLQQDGQVVDDIDDDEEDDKFSGAGSQQTNSNDHHDHMLISSTSTPTSQSSQSPPALPQNASELAQHMLRNILQQSKKDLLAFDQEMQRVAQRQLGLDANAVVNSSELCAMISDSAKQLTKQMVKLEMDSEEAAAAAALSSNSVCADLLSDTNNENNNNNSNNNGNNCKTVKSNKISGKGPMENGGGQVDNSDISSKQQQQQQQGHNNTNLSANHNGVLAHHKAHDNNNNENCNRNENMNVSSDNEDNSMHSVLNDKADKDDDIELLLDQAHHHHNHNSMDALEKRRRSSVSPIISSSSSSGGNKSGGEQPVALDMKRARVENIVSTMRSSPVLPQQNQSAFTPNPVNGCKKRKLYHPQQHDSAADRYAAAAAAGLNLGLNLQNLLMANSHLQQTFLAANAHLNDLNDDDLDDDQHGRNGDIDMSDGDDLATGSGSGSVVESAVVVHQKREEKNALKSQLRSMQEQLAEMQQKYVQLCTRMEQESDAANTIHDVDDNSESELLNDTNVDDIEDLDDDDEPEGDVMESEEGHAMETVSSTGGVGGAPVITTTTTPLLATTTTLSSNRMMRNMPSDNNNNQINNINKTHTNGVRSNLSHQVMNKMTGKMSGNLHPAAAVAAALHSQLPLGGPFGGQSSGNNPLFHHLQQHGGSGAAAAAAAHELLQQQQQQHQQQHQQQQHQNNSAAQQHALSSALSNAWASQKLFLEQEARNLLSKEEDQREIMAMRDREPRTPQNNSNVAMSAQRESSHNSSAPHHSLKGPGQKIQDRLTMMRSNPTIVNSMIGPIMSGNELEGLADMLKSEITASLSHLVDTIVTRFLHQKRFMGKQSEAAAAAAEQLSKDLMMATQLLDRKSPRTKVADRPTGPNQSAAMFQTPKPPTSSQQANHNSKVAALNQVAAAALYNSMNQFCMPPPQLQQSGQCANNQAGGTGNNGNNSHMDGHSGCSSEQTEALPLVVQPKKKRHKVTDTRITPRTVSRILAQDGILPSQLNNGAAGMMSQSPLSLFGKHEEINNNSMNNSNNNNQNGGRDSGSNGNGGNMNRENVGGHQMTSPVSSTATTLTSPQPGNMSSQGNQGSGNSGQKGMNGGGGQNNNGQRDGGNGGGGNNQNSGNSGSGNGGGNQNNNSSANSPMNSPQSRQSHMGGNPNAPMHFHPSLPSLPPNQQSMMPVSLPTSVAIPNPSLPEESEVFSPYSPLFSRHSHAEALSGAGGAGNLLNGGAGLPYGLQPQFGHHHHHHIKMSSSPPGMGGGMLKSRDSPPLPMHHSTMLHPALLAAAHHGNSPDYASHMRHQSMDSNNNTNDRSSDCNDLYDGIQPTISFFKAQLQSMVDISSSAGDGGKGMNDTQISLTPVHSATLTPMHLRKAKLMFFWVRYPSSAVLKMYFPDIRFNKNNTAQLVKWFSNFREFYYIQMEKYARQSVTDGAKAADELHVTADSEIYRVLNLHYNRNNHIEVPQNFRYVVEQTLREFYKSIQCGKDTEQSWKKSIYKIISRLDDPVPEYFKSPNFLEQLE